MNFLHRMRAICPMRKIMLAVWLGILCMFLAGYAYSEELPLAYTEGILDNKVGDVVRIFDGLEICVYDCRYMSHSEIMQKYGEDSWYDGNCWVIEYTINNCGKAEIPGSLITDNMKLRKCYYPLSKKDEGNALEDFWEDFDELYAWYDSGDKFALAFYEGKLWQELNAIRVVNDGASYSDWENLADINISKGETVRVLDIRSDHDEACGGYFDVMAYWFDGMGVTQRISVHELSAPFSDSTWEYEGDLSTQIIVPLWEIGFDYEERTLYPDATYEPLNEWLSRVVSSFQEHIGLEPTGDLDMETYMWMMYKRNHAY